MFNNNVLINAKIIVLLAMLCFSSMLHGQEKTLPFTIESEFITYIQAQSASTPKEHIDEVKSFLSKYSSSWQAVDPEVKEKVMDISLLTLDQNKPFYPFLYDFLRAQSYIDSVLHESELLWLSSMERKMESFKSKDFEKINASIILLSESKCMYSSLQANWFADLYPTKWDSETNSFYFSDIQLSCKAYKDSSVVYGASGYFFPLEDAFIGQGGRVYWNRVGFSEDEIYTEIKSYKINLKSNKYEADTAVLHYPTFLKEATLGRFKDKLIVNKQEESSYPQFYSYDKKTFFGDVFDGLDVVGQYNQQGKKMVFGGDGANAELIVRKGDTIKGRLYSKRIVYSDDKLKASMASWVIYLGASDSIYHNTSDIRYDGKSKEVYIGHSAEISVKMPAINTYHQMMISYENILWKIDSNALEIGLLRVPERKGISVFTSLKMFRLGDFDIIMKGTERNPLYRLKALAEEYGSNNLGLDEIAIDWALSEVTVMPIILQMASMGFLDYNIGKKEITLLPKLYLYLAVSAQKSDFDELEILSSGSEWVKAELHTDSLYMDIYEVERVLFSRKQNVYILPRDNKVRVLYDRDISFDGFLHAGTFDFYVNNAKFIYKDFKIEIEKVDTLLFSINDKDEAGAVKKSKISTLIKSFSGVLYIDSNINKGGLKDIPKYPVFESTMPSYITYNDKYIQSGAYSADSFFFKLEPFRMERLNTFSTDSVTFAGTLVSEGIFPDIKEKLVVMPDLSLGFKTVSSEAGWSAYGGKANFTGMLRLDKNGLVGKGYFDFITSRTNSQALLFLPTAAKGKADRFKLTARVLDGAISYPSVIADSVLVAFNADSTVYSITSLSKPIFPYNKPWSFEGKYSFSEQESKAIGKLLYGTEMQAFSNNWKWGISNIYADSSSIRFGSAQSKALAAMSSVALGGDIESKTMSISPAILSRTAISTATDKQVFSTTIEIEFSQQQYKSKASELLWSWEDKSLLINNTSKKEGSDSLNALPFISNMHSQEGLDFYALQSKFDYSDTTLTVSGVSDLNVADAVFIPDSLRLTIAPNGKIKHFVNAKLMFSKDCRYFSFYGVEGDIVSAKKYKAKGWYDYEANSIEAQSIFFSSIAANSEGFSLAKATVGINDKGSMFRISDGLDFSGKLIISAFDACLRKNADIYFDGWATMSYNTAIIADREGENDYYEETETEAAKRTRRTETEGSATQAEESTTETEVLTAEIEAGLGEDANSSIGAGNGFRVNAYLNKDSVRIPVTALTKGKKGGFMRAGFFMRASSMFPHFTFMETIRSNEQAIVSAEGFLRYVAEDKKYEIIDSLNNNILALSLKDGSASATDFLQLGLRIPALNSTFYGTITRKENEQLFIQSTCAFGFFFAPALFKKTAEDINKNNSLEGIVLTDESLFFDYAEKSLPAKEAQTVCKEMRTYGTLNHIPEKWQSEIVFSHLNFEWDENTYSYRSIGKADVLAIGGQMVNKKLKVMVQISRGRQGDMIDIYLESSRYSWYYFNCTDNITQAISSDPVFNEALSNMKASKRTSAGKEFTISTMRKKNIFVASFEGDTGGRQIEDEETEDTQDTQE